MHKMSKASWIATFAFITSTSFSAQAQEDTYYFGIVPQQAASKLVRTWSPLITELSAKTGLKIKFSTMKDIPTFEKCLAQGAYDIAYMNPYHYTVFSETSGYRAIAHQTDKKLKGLIVVKKGSELNDLDDLKDERIAFPSPAAFGASVVPRAEMNKQGLGIQPVYVKSHDSVFKSVASGVFKAGGGVQRTFNAAPDFIRDQLRVIYQTQEYTPHAFAVGPKVSNEIKKRITKAMLEISVSNNAVIQKIGMKGIEAASDTDWDDVRNLNLTTQHTDIEETGEVKCRY